MRELVLALAIILVSGCVSEPPANETDRLESCLIACNDSFTPNGYVTCKAACYTNDAEEHLEAGRCGAISRMEEFKALGTNSTFWYVTCVGNVALRKRDALACSKIPPGIDQDVCIAGVAESTGNPAICNGINNSMVKEACVADATG
ncbi:MAG TPA: hypothetical protein VLD37_03805 [Candidatus Bilamarchaeum sp.]|nr:hypothetical protein [Candidatus Bilamarchaeum sp.]